MEKTFFYNYSQKERTLSDIHSTVEFKNYVINKELDVETYYYTLGLISFLSFFPFWWIHSAEMPILIAVTPSILLAMLFFFVVAALGSIMDGLSIVNFTSVLCGSCESKNIKMIKHNESSNYFNALLNDSPVTETIYYKCAKCGEVSKEINTFRYNDDWMGRDN